MSLSVALVCAFVVCLNEAECNDKKATKSYSLNFHEVIINSKTENGSFYYDGRLKYPNYSEAGIKIDFWINKLPEFSIDSKQIKDIKIRFLGHEIYAVEISLDVDSKSIIKKFAEYALTKNGLKVAVSIDYKILAIPTITSPFHYSFIFTTVWDNIDSLKREMLKINDRVEIITKNQ